MGGALPAAAETLARGRVYLDHNATSPLRPEARAALLRALEVCGNPSSVHAEGRAARRLLEDARERLGALLGVDPERIIFTSGGTEANALALHQARGTLLVSAVEHPSVLENAPRAERIPVGRSGTVDLAWLEARLARGDVDLVSVMWANNETGILQPVRQVAELCRRFGARFHTDATQAAGRLPLDLSRAEFDLLTLSAHKCGGPVGIGALVLGPGIEIRPLLRGGGQERRRRAGTENVPAACGFAAALAAVDAPERERVRQLRDLLEAETCARVPDVVVIGRDVPRLPNTTMLALPGVPADLLVMRLDLEGIAVSAGSACSSGKMERSHVLEAMGLPPGIAGSAIRISLGHTTTRSELERFVDAFARVARELRALAAPAARTT